MQFFFIQFFILLILAVALCSGGNWFGKKAPKRPNSDETAGVYGPSGPLGPSTNQRRSHENSTFVRSRSAGNTAFARSLSAGNSAFAKSGGDGNPDFVGDEKETGIDLPSYNIGRGHGKSKRKN
uniref:Uncharacterized protein n=1 Tax=Globodera pallida TaxID=36090 RepID=A0A183C820_GLOPA